MNVKQLTLKQSLNKAYRLIKPERAEIEKFKANFKLLLGHINPQESEENMKGLVMDFLKNTYYTPHFHIATKGRTDFVIHTGKDASQPAGVLFEVKRPSNTEMVTVADLNRKAMHEIILYYLRERIEHNNNDIRNIVITNIYEWLVFDAPEFERLFYKNASLVKDYKAWMAKQKVSSNNDLFYNEIAKPFLNALTEEIAFTYFDIRTFEKQVNDTNSNNDNELIPLFKILSPTHLLKLPFANDSNSLDKGFYNELLYLVGLEEVKEGNKKIIRRKQEGKRNDGSLLENTIVQLETENCIHKVTDRFSYGETTGGQLFSVALELCITWINRILFLKLLEAQLLKYHKGNADYKFLNYSVINQYDELYKLFFLVLAKKQSERTERVKAKYSHIPYLNSSLFDRTNLEEQTIRINQLDDEADMPLLDKTVLRDDKNKPIATKLNTLQYLFAFLNAYDFASEGSEEIQEERKTLINASVLGLIFEKINGYKDGSIFTPGFITMYMCRQSIRQAVVNKFTEKYKWKAETFDDLHNYITGDRSAKAVLAYNALINSLTICDPAVGSGHFLVSALNELIAIKSELGILADATGKLLRDHIATVENDELLVTDRERNFFTYTIAGSHEKIHIANAEMQRVQETLFHEKQTLIENCLFGVDINPKSVQICRLRLWIELLKNAYYIVPSPQERAGGEVSALQTLPNIDINIKTGNSLISRFALDEDLKAVFKQGKYSVETYKLVVQTYKDSKSKEEKEQLQDFVKDLKEQFKTIIYQRDPLRKKIADLRGKLLLLENNIDLFGEKKKDEKELAKELKLLNSQIEEKENELKEKEQNKIYNSAFEWRFEFPEVLDNEGSFVGFDVVIGNPPYVDIKGLEPQLVNLLFTNFTTTENRINLYSLFIELGYRVLKDKGKFSFINPNSILMNSSYSKIRNLIYQNVSEIVKLPDNVFAESDVKVETIIISFNKNVKLETLNVIRYKHNENIDSVNTDLKEEQSKKSWNPTDVKFNIYLNNGIQNVLTTALKNTVPLVSLADFTLGITPYDKYRGHTENQIKERGFHSYTKVNEEYKPIISGENIQRYYINPTPKEYIKYGSWLGAPREERFFTEPRIIVRQIVSGNPSRIYAGYTEDSLYFTQIGFSLIPKREKNISPKYITALLNSSLLNFIHKYLYLDIEKELFQKILIENCKQLPIKEISIEEQQPFINLVTRVIEAKQQNKDTRALENEIDKLVYKLYNLTSEEIEIIEKATK